MTLTPSARTDVNRSAILARLGANGPASRAELARTLGVSPALMTQLTRDLIADGLVIEVEQAQSTGGRPAQLLGLAETAGHAIGVKVVADHLTLVEVAIDGRVVRSATEPFDAAASTFLADLVARVRHFLAGGTGDHVLGIGVGVPGTVDSPGSGIVDAMTLGWQQIALGETLRRALALPVLVENNVNALAIAERLYGLGRTSEDFLVVTIGTGIGAGIVMDGSIVRAGGGAGEIGHIPVSDDGPSCLCGNTGCLEAHIGESALVTVARERGVISAGGGIGALRAAADAGDERALAVYSEAGHILGRALAGVVHILDPSLVVVAGEGTLDWKHWSFGFEPAFRAHLMAHRRGIPVDVEQWRDDAWAQGAAALVLATPFDAGDGAGDQGRLIRERLTGRPAPR
jgi:predicted NBD/HSP70 family sugar kinase